MVNANAPLLTSSAAEPAPSAAAVRMRRHRARRRRELRCLTIDLRGAEINALIRRGYLANDTRNDLAAVRKALYHFLDQTLT
jgi:hypothetical protein